MAFFQCGINSETLGNKTSINVLYPQTGETKEYPALYLLHGYSDDHSVWMRRTRLEYYAEAYQIAIIMPDVQRSFYCDVKNQMRGQYWKYVSRELIDITRRMFRLSGRREDTFAAGLSMGGFGAFKLALNCPETFSAGASLSGAVDALSIVNGCHGMQLNEVLTFMDDPSEFNGSINDLFAAAKKTDGAKNKPRLYQYCGTEDFLYEDNVRFRDMMLGLNYDYRYAESPGEHEWGCWDAEIKKVLEWLNVPKV
ncbi:MAG: alpha/beta hydrolase-fold protein [Defluviitaleaceae bacterium]|nr:alpha/beta hydrolase-fold protein [Defluviitaleaceae bacterium]